MDYVVVEYRSARWVPESMLGADLLEGESRRPAFGLRLPEGLSTTALVDMAVDWHEAVGESAHLSWFLKAAMESCSDSAEVGGEG